MKVKKTQPDIYLNLDAIMLTASEHTFLKNINDWYINSYEIDIPEDKISNNLSLTFKVSINKEYFQNRQDEFIPFKKYFGNVIDSYLKYNKEM